MDVNVPVAIVGGGLAGLLSARLLRQAGLDFVLLEARERLGGRILTVDAMGQPCDDGFDLGPSWFWPAMQPELHRLTGELGLTSFVQHTAGAFVFQRSRTEPPGHYPSPPQDPPSMRLAGGTGALVAALQGQVPADRLWLGHRVTQLTQQGEQVVVAYTDPQGHRDYLEATQVILALPPRLLATTVSFAPAVDERTRQRWQETPTWMAPHAKFFAIYETPFWRAAGLSGSAQSLVGPLVEVHDATTASGQAALFGFVGVAAAQRAHVGQEALIKAVLSQLQVLFGPQAGLPLATLLKDWATDPDTATADDQSPSGHPVSDARPWVTGDWQRHIVLAGSETSVLAPGYLAGAQDAAVSAVQVVTERLGLHPRVGQ